MRCQWLLSAYRQCPARAARTIGQGLGELAVCQAHYECWLRKKKSKR